LLFTFTRIPSQVAALKQSEEQLQTELAEGSTRLSAAEAALEAKVQELRAIRIPAVKSLRTSLLFTLR